MVYGMCPDWPLGFVSRLQVSLAALAVALTLVLGGALLGPADARANTVGGPCTANPGVWCWVAGYYNYYYIQDHETYIGSVHTCLKGVKKNGSNYVYGCGYTPFYIAFDRCGCGLILRAQNLANGPRELWMIGKY